MEINDLGGVSEPAKALIEKCGDALGAMAHPYQIVRIAKAEAKASVIKAEAGIEVRKINALGNLEVSEVQKRAVERLLFEEGKKQQNMEGIVAKALPEVSEEADPSQIDDDWLGNFFDKCRLVSDQEMQFLWGKVLAGEANASGTYSKKLVNLLQSLDKSDAIRFQALCNFCAISEFFPEPQPFIYNPEDELYTRNGVYFKSLQDLQSLGLIPPGSPGFGFKVDVNQWTINYHLESYSLTFAQPLPAQFFTGRVDFTQLGRELYTVCATSPIAGFTDYLVQQWTIAGHSVVRLN